LAGPENHLVEAAVRWALEGIPVPGLSRETEGFVPHCPVLFYGMPGCGKTHLAHGIYRTWRLKNRRKRGEYLTGDDFARSLAAALEAKTVNEFHGKMRKAEMLVIDGIDLLESKPAAQEELLTTIDTILVTGKTLVLTMRRFPTRNLFPNERLMARLTAGLVVPIALPGLISRVAMLKLFAEQLGLHLTAPAVQTLAKELPVSVPQLFGTLAQLSIEPDNEIIDLATVREVLRQNASVAVIPTMDKIAKTTARQMGLKLVEMKGKSRKSTTVRARNIAIYLARQLTQTSLKEVGLYFGGRDHTTIAHSSTEIESKISEDTELRSLVLQIRELLQGYTEAS